ncbi:hypothetical protein BGZ83_006408 [Gryganskiella cystojenkinii]|nr:hypothetical protein BGZ83_006408 [Gryganskiella cystojenkinii]
MASILKPAFAYYNRQYQARPILTICTTNAVLAGISDTLTQKYLAPSSATTSSREELAQDIEQTLWHEPEPDQTKAQDTADLIRSKIDQAQNQMSQVVSGSGSNDGKDLTVEEKRSQREQQISQKIDETKEMVKDSAQAVKSTIKGSVQSAKDSAQFTKDTVRDIALSAKNAVNDTAQSAKDTVKDTTDAAADSVKTLGQQTTKEVKDRGLESAKDMGEGYSKAGQESLGYGMRVAQEKLHDLTEEAKPSMDVPRLGRFMLYNFSVAPLIHTWYTVLDKHFPVPTKPDTTHTTSQVSRVRPIPSKVVQTLTPGFKRMVADQALFAPVGLALLFSGLTVLEGGGVKEIKAKLNSTYIDTLKANYMVWPIVQLVNFSVMPLQFRLPFVSVVGIAWNAYLSFVNTRGMEAQKRELQNGHNSMAVAS